MKPEIEVLNLAQINKDFDALYMTDKERKQVLGGTLRSALGKIIKTARANLKNDKTGALRKALGTIVKIRQDTISGASGARSSNNPETPKGFHFHFINSGTEQRTTAGGFNRGKVEGTGFFDNAVKSHLGNIGEDLQEAYTKRMEKFMREKY